jgi:hypothetical protein
MSKVQGDWREAMARYTSNGEEMERLAESLPGDGWQVDWIGRGLIMWGTADIHAFAKQVEGITSALREAPAKVEPDSTHRYLDAKWTVQYLGKPACIALHMRGADCRWIERDDGEDVLPARAEVRVRRKRIVLHPECAHVIDTLGGAL